ncbi:MAG: hypothetical protein QE271_08700 [Bacteriovoracaceae bacterium]|nr:hypothetical protein [Bacteriovoracaceae bacterium]
MRVAIVSVCQKICQGPKMIAQFHFIGHWNGTKLKGVKIDRLTSLDGEKFIPGEGYLLYVEAVTIDHSILYSKLIYSKKLCEVYCV